MCEQCCGVVVRLGFRLSLLSALAGLAGVPRRGGAHIPSRHYHPHHQGTPLPPHRCCPPGLLSRHPLDCLLSMAAWQEWASQRHRMVLAVHQLESLKTLLEKLLRLPRPTIPTILAGISDEVRKLGITLEPAQPEEGAEGPGRDLDLQHLLKQALTPTPTQSLTVTVTPTLTCPNHHSVFQFQ